MLYFTCSCPRSLFGMLHCALNTTAENLDLITRLGLAKDRRTCKIWGDFHLLKFSDVRIYDCSIDILDIPCLSRFESPAEETDSYLRSLFTRMLYVAQQYLDHPDKNTVTLPSKLRNLGQIDATTFHYSYENSTASVKRWTVVSNTTYSHSHSQGHS